MSSLIKVHRGQRFVPKASDWNAFIDAAKDFYNRQSNLTANELIYPNRSGVVIVKNVSGKDLERFSAVAIKDIAIDPDENEQEFITRIHSPAFECDLANKIDSDWDGSIAVLTEPIEKNGCGKAIIAGTFATKLKVIDEQHGYCGISYDDDSSELVSMAEGFGRIIYKQSGTGLLWAVVILKAEPGDFGIVNNTAATIKEGYAIAISSQVRPFVFNVSKPAKDSQLNVFAYSGADLPAGKVAWIKASDMMRFKVDSLSGISAGDFVGTEANSFTLKKNRFGFLVLATETTTQGSFVYTRYNGMVAVLKAVADADNDTIDVKHADSNGTARGTTFTLDIIPE